MTTPGYVIMIVDDDTSMRRAARRLIKSHGFAVETFASAEDFLASEQLKHGVEELDRKAGPKLDQAGREIKEESRRAAEKVKERADHIQGSDQPERK